MVLIQKPKGTKDYFDIDSAKLTYLENKLAAISFNYGFTKITFPVFENEELFRRTTGEGTDIVDKEMYTFLDKGGRNLSLRPEGTASVSRLLIENKLIFRNEEKRYFYLEKMYRYERPQKGRQREFFQFGVEFFNANSIYNDLEIIDLAITILDELKINNYVLKINSIGSSESRKKYQEALKTYLLKYELSLSQESQNRLNKNIFRILDSKQDIDKELLKNAPKISDFLSNKEAQDFDFIKRKLLENNISFEVDLYLVRGLDYYNDLVFEFIEKDSNLTIIGGGRYDTLISMLQPNLIVKAIGFAIGIERILNLINIESPKVNYYIASTSKNPQIFDILKNEANLKRKNNISVITDFKTNKYDSLFKLAKYHNCENLLLLDFQEEKNLKKIIISID